MGEEVISLQEGPHVGSQGRWSHAKDRLHKGKTLCGKSRAQGPIGPSWVVAEARKADGKELAGRFR